MIKTSQNGAAMLLFVLFFAFTSSVMMFALNQSIFIDLSDYNRLNASKQAYLASESIVEDVTYRYVFESFSISTVESLTLGGVTAYATTTYDSASDVYEVNGQSTLNTAVRKTQALLAISGGSAFNYGLQAGNGGVELTNSATIIGNVYSNGTVEGFNYSLIRGDVVSAGPTGKIDDVHATGTVYANTIERLRVDGDAHYNSFTGATSTILGTQYRPAPNQPPATLPLSTTTIQSWKDSVDDAISGGGGEYIPATDPVCSTGTYTINVDRTIGFIKIGCNLVIQGNNTDITLTGPVWVEGNITFSNGPNIRVDSSLGRKSVQIMAASSTNKTTSSRITVAQSTSFDGSGDSRSFIMILSENESASLGGPNYAIQLGNSSQGDLLVYTADGLVDIAQQIHLTEVTGYKISIGNNSSVTYQSGLASLLFTSGPGAGYRLSDWRQMK